ncbi:permease-like cell division protein FtsX [Acetivibrio saccincola]|jgi:cell division transport system permease protein|uniref:Cell division protein FtsX n=1 Tax=Acetivibrio saccincola TaxID=1677857 RepID=A0A2S8R8L9_9FIRM|nr:permease-like cell division protein FtsX [Acetivibrio saccincola]NLW26896.1 ABC transporter permease [Acetivibrio saccincola]PQQ66137.1 cell division protein FtsX [Acetivibrio saccincola]HOA97322.1 permease-like cell division protein FtsX [Acetivibrio saccincola]HQD29079.1 permease-like cell division protein FtsX [Acetivibrio saccincola]
MKLRTGRYILKEGIINIHKNILMSFASITVVTASLIILGGFFAIIANINHNINRLSEKPEMGVFCNAQLDDSEVASIEWLIMSDDRIKEYTIVTKEEAYKEVEELLDNNKSLMEGLGNDFLSVSFSINLANSEYAEEVVNKLSVFPGVDKVEYSKRALDLMSKVRYWVRVGSSFILFLLIAISVVIISNTIKLAVFARRKEINIMKYIGATDWFIRLPFIVEGVIIGLIGAIMGFGLLNFIYTRFFNKFDLTLFGLEMIHKSEFFSGLILNMLLIGVIVGALGSVVSIRKHLRV